MHNHPVQKIAILTDSSSSIYKVKHDYDNLFMIDLPCFIGDEIFTDFKKNLDDVFYKAIKTAASLPKTSQPSIGETLEKYEEIKALGFTDIIYLPISKELSGTYQNGHLSIKMIEGVSVEIIDTLTTVSILGGMALEAARLAKDGKTVAEIKERVLEIRRKSMYYCTVDDLTALVKNGRLSNAKSLIANLLKIKPVIILNNEGKLVSLESVRTFKGALKKLVERCVAELDVENGVIHIAYTENLDSLELAKNYILELVPNAKIEVYTIPATVVAHIGLAAIGVGYINY